MYFASVEFVIGPLFLRDRGRCVLLVLMAAAALIAGLAAPAAAEVELKTASAKSYEIVFQGNTAISGTALSSDAAKELDAFDKQGQRPADIDDAAYQMQLAYRAAGYAFAKVDYRIEKKQAMTTVTFLISEGPRVIVRDIILSGNKAFDDKTLKAYFKKAHSGLLPLDEHLFVRSTVESAVAEIRQRYLTHGYLDAVVDAPVMQFTDDRSQVSITLNIAEGVQYTVHRIDFRGDVLARGAKRVG